jgi:transaldolase
MKFKTKIFADGADIEDIKKLNTNKMISGFTTNPSLMKKANIKNYEVFSKEVLTIIGEKPISFEVFSDELDEMYNQAKKISSWGNNVYVKIPITNTRGDSVFEIIKELTAEGIKLNITAIMALDQVKTIFPALENSNGAYISVFAGRIADTGIDPVPLMADVVNILSSNDKIKLIWASPREVLNVIQCEEIQCHIITATSDIINKLNLIGKDLHEYSLETVKDFYKDALIAGYKI